MPPLNVSSSEFENSSKNLVTTASSSAPMSADGGVYSFPSILAISWRRSCTGPPSAERSPSMFMR